jgi:hypothetical protein
MAVTKLLAAAALAVLGLAGCTSADAAPQHKFYDKAIPPTAPQSVRPVTPPSYLPAAEPIRKRPERGRFNECLDRFSMETCIAEEQLHY